MTDRKVKTAQKLLPHVKEGINPFPGLRPFGIEESYLFFGRDGQSEEILELLAKNRFAAVIGASGTGKSSVIYCGLLPLLYGGFIASAGARWRIIPFRPGNNPVENIAKAIAKSYQSEKGQDNPYTDEFFAAILRRSSFGIAEALKFLPNAGKENILLLADQFEELFRYRSYAQGNDEPEAFVRLLVEAMNQSEIPIYTVLTMRSDFIGECSQYQELTALINKSNYLIPQMTRDDFRSAITGPLQVSGAHVDPALVNQILNDVGDNADQLPILQHAMMRTWDYWRQNENDESLIGIDEYEAVGTLSRALSDHANEAYDELNEQGKRICEVLFKTITEKGADNRGVRRPTRLADIAEIAKASVEDVALVADTFRKAGRSFLAPSAEIPLTPDSIIDLSHESLMRIWNRLKVWVEEEFSAVQMYMRLSEASALYQKGKAGLWRPPDLLLALSWETKLQPSLTWAKRYNPAFERTIVFLHTSGKEFQAEERNKIRQQKRALQRAKISAIVLGSAAILSLAFMIYANLLKGEAKKSEVKAIIQSQKAGVQKRLAEWRTKEATQQKSEALKQKEYADKQSKVASQQREIAIQKQQEALEQKTIADKNAIEATESQKKAEISAQEAKRQQLSAEKAKEEANTRRMLSISQALAVKTLRVDDKDLKALLAYQSFLFNKKYKGEVMNPDIYAGLYSAISAQKGSGYNQHHAHSDAVNSIVFATNSSIFYSAGSDGRIYKWNLQDTTAKGIPFFEHRFVNKCLAMSENNHWLACGSLGGGLILLDLSGKSAHQVINDFGPLIYAVGFVKSDVLVAGAENKLIKYNLTTGQKTVLATTDGTILTLSVSPDATNVAIGTSSGKIIMLNLLNPGPPEVLYDDPKNQVYSLCFNHAGDNLASGGTQGYLRIWNVREKKQTANIRSHSARITCIQYSPDDKLIATTSYDQAAILWNATNINAQPIKLQDHDSWVMSLAFNSAGTSLITGALREPRLISWSTNITSMAAILYPMLKRNFNQTEWDTYIGNDIPYETIKP
jgi:WD40 repeat protein